MMGIRDHIDLLMKAFLAHRDGVDPVFSKGVIPEVKILAQELDYASAMRRPAPPTKCIRFITRFKYIKICLINKRDSKL